MKTLIFLITVLGSAKMSFAQNAVEEGYYVPKGSSKKKLKKDVSKKTSRWARAKEKVKSFVKNNKKKLIAGATVAATAAGAATTGAILYKKNKK